jgi:hypothetical protein
MPKRPISSPSCKPCRRNDIKGSCRPRPTPGTSPRGARAALADPKLKARLVDLGGTVLPGSPADFGKLIADETEKWGKVIRAANIKAQ